MKLTKSCVLGTILLFSTLVCHKNIFYPNMIVKKNFLIGHRGARGLAPENTMPAFLKAIENNMSAIEFDVILTKDKKLIIHHDMHTNPNLCKAKDGTLISSTAIGELPSSYLENLDCGSIQNIRFPEQKIIPNSSPITLENFFRQIIQIEKKNKSIQKSIFLIEIKLEQKDFPENHKYYLEESINRAIKLIEKYKFEKRSIIQSFSLEAISYAKKRNAKIKTAALFSPSKITSFKLFIGLGSITIAKHIIAQTKDLGASYISPNILYINPKFVELCHKEKIAIFVWTINSESEMLRMMKMGVDGIITDYPDRLYKVWKKWRTN